MQDSIFAGRFVFLSEKHQRWEKQFEQKHRKSTTFSAFQSRFFFFFTSKLQVCSTQLHLLTVCGLFPPTILCANNLEFKKQTSRRWLSRSSHLDLSDWKHWAPFEKNSPSPGGIKQARAKKEQTARKKKSKNRHFVRESLLWPTSTSWTGSVFFFFFQIKKNVVEQKEKKTETVTHLC